MYNSSGKYKFFLHFKGGKFLDLGGKREGRVPPSFCIYNYNSLYFD
jgi:hypothetical protein